MNNPSANSTHPQKAIQSVVAGLKATLAPYLTQKSLLKPTWAGFRHFVWPTHLRR